MLRYFYSMQDVISSQIKYILSIGKRQPMHIGHKRSLERILAMKNTKLIYVMGSVNAFGDPLFDPFTNPLNLAQQEEQFKLVFPDADAILLPILDVADMGKWGPSIVAALNKFGISAAECAIHFIGKEEDRLAQSTSFNLEDVSDAILRKGQWLIEALAYYGFTMWFDNEFDVNLSISARNLRSLDLENLGEQEKALLACPEYLCDLAKKAREKNPDKLYLANEPISLKDLSLIRLRGW